MSILDELKAQGRNVKELKNGAIYDLDKGRIVANPGGGAHAITSDNAHAFLARRREVGLMAQLRGMAKAKGIQPPDDATIQDLADSAGVALEAFTQHMGQTFLQSKSLRGMSEAYNTLASPLIGDKRQRDDAPEPGDQINILVFLAEFAQSYPSMRNDSDDVLEGEVNT